MVGRGTYQGGYHGSCFWPGSLEARHVKLSLLSGQMSVLEVAEEKGIVCSPY